MRGHKMPGLFDGISLEDALAEAHERIASVSTNGSTVEMLPENVVSAVLGLPDGRYITLKELPCKKDSDGNDQRGIAGVPTEFKSTKTWNKNYNPQGIVTAARSFKVENNGATETWYKLEVGHDTMVANQLIANRAS